MVMQNSLLIREFLKNFYVSSKNAKKGPKKCPVYLKLSWIGENSLKFDKKFKKYLLRFASERSNHE